MSSSTLSSVNHHRWFFGAIALSPLLLRSDIGKLRPLASAVKQNLCYHYAAWTPITEADRRAPADRRARRRQETIEEILVIAEDVMTEEGVNGLSLSEVARRLGVKPPSIYKYFDSIMGIYDALFERGQRDNLEVMRAAMERAEPGLDALAAGLEASGRWALDHPGHGAAAVLAAGSQLRADARGHGPQHRDGPAPTPGAGRRGGREAARSRRRLRRGALRHIGPRQRRHRPGDGQRARPPLGRGPLQPAAPQAPRHCSPPCIPRSPSTPGGSEASTPADSRLCPRTPDPGSDADCAQR